VPEAITNFLGLLGWNPGLKTADGKDLEKFDMAFLAQHFDIERIGKSNAKFDRKKLESFNADYLAALPEAEYARRLRQWCTDSGPRHTATRALSERLLKLSDEKLGWLIAAIRPRTRKFSDIAASTAFLSRDDSAPDFDAKAVEKGLKADNNAGLTLLRELRAALAALAEWTPAALHALFETQATSRGFVTTKVPTSAPSRNPSESPSPAPPSPHLSAKLLLFSGAIPPCAASTRVFRASAPDHSG
jgi:glutamyl-tRNA synthetase